MNPLRRIVPRSLFWRSFLIMLIPLVLLQAVVAYIFFERHWDSVSRQLALDIAGDVKTVMRFMQERPEPEMWSWIERIAREEMQFTVAFTPGAVLPDEAPKRTDRIMDRLLHQEFRWRFDEPHHIDTRYPGERIAIRVQRPDGVLTMLTPVKRMRSSTTVLVILWMVGTAIVVSTIAMVFLRNQICRSGGSPWRPTPSAGAGRWTTSGRRAPPKSGARPRPSSTCGRASGARSASAPRCWRESPTTCGHRSRG